jgi:hypothetical protein
VNISFESFILLEYSTILGDQSVDCADILASMHEDFFWMMG